MNKADCGAVPQFLFYQENMKQFTLVGTCIVINKAYASKIGCIIVFLKIIFHFRNHVVLIVCLI